MRTTLNIPDRLFRDLQEVTSEKSKTKAICVALEDYIKQKKLKKLLSLKGKLPLENNWKELEDIELKDIARHEKKSSGRH